MKKLLLSIFTIISIGLGANAQNYVLKFDGVDDFVNMGTDAADGLRSVEFWFKPETTINNTLANPEALVYRADAVNQGNFGFYFGPTGWTGQQGKLVFQNKIGTTNTYIVSDSDTWTAGVWYHVAGVIDPTTGMKLYIDGVYNKTPMLPLYHLRQGQRKSVWEDGVI